MHNKWIYIALGVAAVALLAGAGRGATPPQPAEPPADPFAQSQFDLLLAALSQVPSRLRAVAARALGFQVAANGVFVPRGVRAPGSSRVSDGSVVHPMW